MPVNPKTLRGTAEAVARSLGDGWAATVGEFSAHIEHSDGRRILLDSRGEDAYGRYVISGCFPPAGQRYARRQEIRVGFGRPWGEVSDAIKEKLLPDYETELDRVRSQLARDAAEEAAREAVAESLLALPGVRKATVGGRSDDLRIKLPGYGRHLTVRSAATRASLELADLPAELAVRVARYILAELTTEEGPTP